MKIKKIFISCLLAITFVIPWAISEPTSSPHHGVSVFGEFKYPPDFDHFDYVNPTAPKGGTLRLAVDGTFDSFNSFIPKGNAASTGSVEIALSTSARCRGGGAIL